MIKISLNFALMLLDDYSGAVVGDGLRFMVNGQAFTPLRKPEGYLVFAGLEGTRFQVSLDSLLYEPRQFEVETKAKGQTCVQVRLLRRNLPAFSDCEFLCGTYNAGEDVYAAEEGGSPLRMQAINPEETGARLILMGYLLPGMVRQRFFLGEKRKREAFIIDGQTTDGAYLTKRPFIRAHEQGEPVVRAFHAVCGPDGRFSIPVSPGQASQIKRFGYFGKGGLYGTACL